MKLFILALVLFVSCYSQSQDNADTPNILLGEWTSNGLSEATSSSQCCFPAGNLAITNNGDNTVTLTSTSWVGEDCHGRSSSYQQIINVNGASSFNQLKAAYSPSEEFTTTDGSLISFSMMFNQNLAPELVLFYIDPSKNIDFTCALVFDKI